MCHNNIPLCHNNIKNVYIAPICKKIIKNPGIFRKSLIYVTSRPHGMKKKWTKISPISKKKLINKIELEPSLFIPPNGQFLPQTCLKSRPPLAIPNGPLCNLGSENQLQLAYQTIVSRYTQPRQTNGNRRRTKISIPANNGCD